MNTGQLQLPAPSSYQISSQSKAQPTAKPTTQPKAQSQPRTTGDGWGCVRPYNKDTATGKQRVTSCEKSATGTYPNRQLCVQECHL